jgi:pimeloyl-ACP methyl ester carboxylesterase
MIARLTGRFRCIAYDLPSGGGDGARLTRYHHHDLVEDALALLDYLGIRCSYLFGSSFGSTIALAAMRLYPDRLRRALVQGGFARRPLARMEHLMASLVRFWPGSMRIMPLRAATLRRVNGPLFAGKPPEAWDYFMERSNAHSIAAVAHRALMVHHLDLQPILPEIRQPILLICGDSDPLVSRHCDDALLEGLPNARRLELFNCGHNPLFTHPEILAEVVTRFLTPPPDSQPR